MTERLTPAELAELVVECNTSNRAVRVTSSSLLKLIAAAREAERLREALTEMLEWFYPLSEEEGVTGHYDRLAMRFYSETRIWPPGKAAPLEMLIDDREREAAHRAWDEWGKSTKAAIRDRARAALAGKDGE